MEQASSVEGFRTHVPVSHICHLPLLTQSLSVKHSVGLLLGNDEGPGDEEGSSDGPGLALGCEEVEGLLLGLLLGVEDGCALIDGR